MGKNAWQTLMTSTSPAAAVIRPVIEFLFPHRLHRLNFYLRLLAAGIVADLFDSQALITSGSFYWTGLAIMVDIYCLFFIILPRFRDIGMNGWALLGLIPPANFVFGYILMFRAPSYWRVRPNTESTVVTTATGTATT
jgi:hypothetical protein